jgi:hypothetical protein
MPSEIDWTGVSRANLQKFFGSFFKKEQIAFFLGAAAASKRWAEAHPTIFGDARRFRNIRGVPSR